MPKTKYFVSRQRRLRRCLGYCSRMFMSSGPQHRICAACQGRQQGKQIVYTVRLPDKSDGNND